MFGNLFGNKPEKKPSDPRTTALLHAIRARSKTDPLAGAKIGAKEVLERVMVAMKNERGVHVESLLCMLGALAGYSCQASLRAQALARGMPQTAAFQTVETTDGKKFFFGDALNNALAGSKYSVWSLAAAAAQHAGAKELPDINEMFEHTSSVLGSPQFGVPRMPEGHGGNDTPKNYLKVWPALFPTVKMFCPNPVDWPTLFGLAIQQAIEMGASAIAPELALKIVMECAIPMSKVDREDF